MAQQRETAGYGNFVSAIFCRHHYGLGTHLGEFVQYVVDCDRDRLIPPDADGNFGRIHSMEVVTLTTGTR